MNVIIGYTFDADTYCGEHVLEALLKAYTDEPDKQGPMNGGTNVFDTHEANLDRMAEALGVNRAAEGTFDSGDFPKTITIQHLDGGNEFVCCECGEIL